MMRPKRSYYFLAVVALPLLVLLQNPNISEPVHGFSLTILKPALMAGRSAASFLSDCRRTAVRFWKSFQDQKEYEEKIQQLESELLRLREVSRENDRLRKLLDFRKTISEKGIAARVIGWDASAWRKTLILDKGKKHGIKKDMTVVVPEGLVGRVLEAGPSVSRVILVLDPDARVSASASQSRAQGIVAGDGSSKLKMNYLELDGGAAVEEVVLTSGVSGLYPKGIRIGKIVGLEKDLDGLHLTAELEPYVSFTKLEEVLCLASSQEK